MIRNNIVTYAEILGGSFLTLIGLLGFVTPSLLGLHLSALLNMVHLITGLTALYFGLRGASLLAARNICLGTGMLYCVIALVGFVMGSLGNSLIHALVGALFVAAAMLQPLRLALYAPR